VTVIRFCCARYFVGGTGLLAEWKNGECTVDQKMVAVQELPFAPTPLILMDVSYPRCGIACRDRYLTSWMYRHPSLSAVNWFQKSRALSETALTELHRKVSIQKLK
jgi:hypothetical protein